MSDVLKSEAAEAQDKDTQTETEGQEKAVQTECLEDSVVPQDSLDVQ